MVNTVLMVCVREESRVALTWACSCHKCQIWKIQLEPSLKCGCLSFNILWEHSGRGVCFGIHWCEEAGKVDSWWCVLLLLWNLEEKLPFDSSLRKGPGGNAQVLMDLSERLNWGEGFIISSCWAELWGHENKDTCIWNNAAFLKIPRFLFLSAGQHQAPGLLWNYFGRCSLTYSVRYERHGKQMGKNPGVWS